MEKAIIIKELIKGIVSDLDILEGDINLDRVIVEEVDENKLSFRFVSYKNDYRLTNFFRKVINKNSLSFEDVNKINYRQSKTLVGEALIEDDFINVHGTKLVKEEIDINNGEITEIYETESEIFNCMYMIKNDNNNFKISEVDVNTQVNSFDKGMKTKDKDGK